MCARFPAIGKISWNIELTSGGVDIRMKHIIVESYCLKIYSISKFYQKIRSYLKYGLECLRRYHTGNRSVSGNWSSTASENRSIAPIYTPRRTNITPNQTETQMQLVTIIIHKITDFCDLMSLAPHKRHLMVVCIVDCCKTTISTPKNKKHSTIQW